MAHKRLRGIAAAVVRVSCTQYGGRFDPDSATPAIVSGHLLLAGPDFIVLDAPGDGESM